MKQELNSQHTLADFLRQREQKGSVNYSSARNLEHAASLEPSVNTSAADAFATASRRRPAARTQPGEDVRQRMKTGLCLSFSTVRHESARLSEGHMKD